MRGLRITIGSSQEGRKQAGAQSPRALREAAMKSWRQTGFIAVQRSLLQVQEPELPLPDFFLLMSFVGFQSGEFRHNLFRDCEKLLVALDTNGAKSKALSRSHSRTRTHEWINQYSLPHGK